MKESIEMNKICLLKWGTKDGNLSWYPKGIRPGDGDRVGITSSAQVQKGRFFMINSHEIMDKLTGR